MGWSSAWHLLSRSPSLQIAVIDPDPSRCTSQRGAGGSRAQFSTEVNIALSMLSIAEFEKFGEMVGGDISYRQHGYLLYTADVHRAENMKAAASFQRERGVRVDELSISELKQRVPCLDVSDVVYAHIGTQDGYLDGPVLHNSYRLAALKLGATEISAKALDISPTHVVTSEGSLSAAHVVVATGHWSGDVGLGLPVRPEKHQLYFANVGSVDPHWPFTIDADTTYHFRPYGDQIIVCFNDATLCSGEHSADEQPQVEESVLDRLLPIIEKRSPGFISRDRITGMRAGFYAVTPDRHPLLGRHQGLIVASGFGGHGIMHSPGAGRVVSEIILDGDAKSIDIRALSPGRFAKGELVHETFVF